MTPPRRPRFGSDCQRFFLLRLFDAGGTPYAGHRNSPSVTNLLLVSTFCLFRLRYVQLMEVALKPASPGLKTARFLHRFRHRPFVSPPEPKANREIKFEKNCEMSSIYIKK